MNIVNCFLFFNEIDLTLLRFHELYDVVDRFVIVEGRQTFTGLPKPLNFQANRALFAPYEDKIRYIVPDWMPGHDINPWVVEGYSRNHFIEGIHDCAPDDWLIITDADEIPRRSAVEQLRSEPYERMLLDMDFYYYTFNHRLDTRWRVNALRRGLYVNGSQARSVDAPEGTPVLLDAGWHFSFLGDVESIRAKLAAYSHTEYNTSYWNHPARIQRMIDEDIELFERKESFPITRVNVTPKTHPPALFERPDIFGKYMVGRGDFERFRGKSYYPGDEVWAQYIQESK